MNMFGGIITGFLLLFFVFLPATAQEKIVDTISVNFGIVSWEEIQQGMTTKAATQTAGYHLKMARKMAMMHGGGGKGTYHLLVVLDDKKTGKRIEKAEVEVHVSARFGPQKEVIKLKPMTMDGFSGFGAFVKIKFKGPYNFKVSFRSSKKEAFKEVEFEKEMSP